MNARARGFTLVEVLIVTVLSALVMAAVYQTLTVQMRSNRQVNAVVGTQQTIRTAMQVLQSELREVGGRPGDIRSAQPESLTVRALRKVGFVCAVGGTNLQVYTVGDLFSSSPADTLLIYATRATGADDDTMRMAVVTAVAAASTCTKLTGMPWDSLKSDVKTLSFTKIPSTWALSDVNPGDPIRSFETVTYGIFQKGGQYVLGRRTGADSVVTLIGPLATPANGGLRLTYLNTLNQTIATANLAAQKDSIARVRVSVKGTNKGASAKSMYSDSIVTDIFLRGN